MIIDTKISLDIIDIKEEYNIINVYKFLCLIDITNLP